jgi:AraC family transcriptional activator of pobA
LLMLGGLLSQEYSTVGPLAGLNGLPVGVALAVRAEEFAAALATRSWVVRQKGERRAHLFLLLSDRGDATWQETRVELSAPALLWLPGNVDAAIEASAGAQGFLLSIDDDFLIKTVANSPEALDLRRTGDRVALIAAETLAPHLDATAASCRALVVAHAGARRGNGDRCASAAALPASVATRRRA